MSREIKFRAWNGEQLRDVNTIGWTNGELDWIDTSKNHGPINEDIKLMQYTGLKDKNGVDIYEGDYLKNNKKNILEVVFEKGQFLFEHKTGRYAEKGWSFKYDAVGTGEELEVIGNIYENKNLLEEK